MPGLLRLTPAAATTSTSSLLRVMTYNVRYDSMPDNITVRDTIRSLPTALPQDPPTYYADTGERPWSTRRVHVANDVLLRAVDIFGMFQRQQTMLLLTVWKLAKNCSIAKYRIFKNSSDTSTPGLGLVEMTVSEPANTRLSSTIRQFLRQSVAICTADGRTEPARSFETRTHSGCPRRRLTSQSIQAQVLTGSPPRPISPVSVATSLSSIHISMINLRASDDLVRHWSSTERSMRRSRRAALSL